MGFKGNKMNKKLKQLLIALTVLSTYVYAESTVKLETKWITPEAKVCKKNGGKSRGSFCKADWDNAKRICSAAGGMLPSLNELESVITSCGGKIDANDNNRNDRSYQSCYTQKGFSPRSYWSSTILENYTSDVWGVKFNFGYKDNYVKTLKLYVRCVRGR